MIQKKWMWIMVMMIGAVPLIFSGISRADEPREVDVKFALQMEGNTDGQPLTVKLDKTLQMTGNAEKLLTVNPQIIKALGDSKKSEERSGNKNIRNIKPGRPGTGEQEK